MIRPAALNDIPRVKEMLHAMLADSKLAGRMGLSDKVMTELLLSALARQRSPVQFGSYFQIIEREERAVGFMIGILDRVYHIGTKLVAQDQYLYAEKGTPFADVSRLVDGYITWGRQNPKVLFVNLSWTDTLPGAERMGKLYERKGARHVGGIYEIALDMAAQEEAA